MAEEVVGVDDKAFRIRFPVPKRCQEIRQIKIEYVNQPFFTVFWIEKHKKMQGKTGLKYREGGCTVGSGRVATIIE